MPKRTRSETAAAKQEKETETKPNKVQKEMEIKPRGDQLEDADENLNAFELPFKKDKQILCETRRSLTSKSHSLIFTHGAGGGIESAAMRSFATGFCRHGRITSFKGNMNLTSRIGMFRTVASHHQDGHKGDALVLGGRSMGARAAVLAALELISEGIQVGALVLVSYPLTASKNEKQEREFERREKILLDLPESVDVLFICGTKDAQCDLESLKEVRGDMKAKNWMVEAIDADHGMNIVPKAGTQAGGELMGEVAANWLEKRGGEQRTSKIYWDQEDEKAVHGVWR